jgi:hypothetical protein
MIRIGRRAGERELSEYFRRVAFLENVKELGHVDAGIYSRMVIPLMVAGLAVGLGQGAKATLTFEYPEMNTDVRSLIRFQKIGIDKLRFSGEALTGKAYELWVRRIDDGKETMSSALIDSGPLGSLGQVKGGELTVTLVSQVREGQAKISAQFPRFSIDKVFDARESKYDYVMKNFLGAETKIEFDPTKEMTFMAFLLPTEHGDGSASYCEVAQSGVEPKQLGEKFKIPTYFLISIKFKDVK